MICLLIILGRTNAARPSYPPISLQRFADRKSTRLNSSHQIISYAVFCLKKKKNTLVPLLLGGDPHTPSVSKIVDDAFGYPLLQIGTFGADHICRHADTLDCWRQRAVVPD